jgi:predicted DNA binding CopG/RHH family protein
MKKHNIDTDMPVGKLKKIKDTLPPPEELMIPERTVKVTLRLSENSIRFFKCYAEKYHTKYQKVIRKLIDTYAEKYPMPQ